MNIFIADYPRYISSNGRLVGVATRSKRKPPEYFIGRTYGGKVSKVKDSDVFESPEDALSELEKWADEWGWVPSSFFFEKGHDADYTEYRHRHRPIINHVIKESVTLARVESIFEEINETRSKKLLPSDRSRIIGKLASDGLKICQGRK